jgi:hypothetical protein
MRDGCSVNNLAMEILRAGTSPFLDVPCFCHALNNAGEEAEPGVMGKFVTHWASLFSQSSQNKLAWKTLTSLSEFPTVSPTRWWSLYELYVKVLERFGDIEDFITKSELAKSSKKTRLKLQELLAGRTREIKAVLAAFVDAGDCFIKATYRLESDAPLAPCVADIIEGIRLFVTNPKFPNLDLVTTTVTVVPEERAALQQLGRDAVQPMFDYFLSHFIAKTGAQHAALEAFKTMRVFSSSRYVAMSSLARDSLEPLQQILTPQLRSQLQLESGTYLTLCETYACVSDDKLLEWWQLWGNLVPAWKSAARLVFFVQLSSAPAERAFSLLTNMFTPQQSLTLGDRIEASLMARFNDAK